MIHGGFVHSSVPAVGRAHNGVETAPRPRLRPYRVAFASVLAALAGFSVNQAWAAADTTPPTTPSGVKATFYGKVGAVVTWSKVSSSDLDHYNVYRSASKPVA